MDRSHGVTSLFAATLTQCRIISTIQYLGRHFEETGQPDKRMHLHLVESEVDFTWRYGSSVYSFNQLYSLRRYTQKVWKQLLQTCLLCSVYYIHPVYKHVNIKFPSRSPRQNQQWRVELVCPRSELASRDGLSGVFLGTSTTFNHSGRRLSEVSQPSKPTPKEQINISLAPIIPGP